MQAVPSRAHHPIFQLRHLFSFADVASSSLRWCLQLRFAGTTPLSARCSAPKRIQNHGVTAGNSPNRFVRTTTRPSDTTPWIASAGASPASGATTGPTQLVWGCAAGKSRLTNSGCCGRHLGLDKHAIQDAIVQNTFHHCGRSTVRFPGNIWVPRRRDRDDCPRPCTVPRPNRRTDACAGSRALTPDADKRVARLLDHRRRCPSVTRMTRVTVLLLILVHHMTWAISTK